MTPTRLLRGWIFSLLLAGLWLAGLAHVATAQSPQEGEAIFQQKCVACHTIGGGPQAGPDLQGVTSQRDRAWLIRWITAPDQVLSEGDPIATQLLQAYNNVPMPNLGISQAQAVAIVEYLATASPAGAARAPAAATLPPGDAAAGRALFLGRQPLANRGPACISCHSAGYISLLGGGTLGPDLTHVVRTYGDAGLQAALQGLPFPTMQGVYAGQPLTDQEAANLHAYLVQEDQTAAAQGADYHFVWLGLSGSLLLLGLGHITWIKRNQGVRKPLVGR